MAKTFFPDSTQLDTLNGHLNDISVTLGGQNVLTRENLINLLGYEPVKPEGNYELIETIAVSDDTTTVIERTAEPDGTAYDFKKIIIRVSIPAQDAAGSNYFATRINDKFFIWSPNAISKTAVYFWQQVERKNGVYEQRAQDAYSGHGEMTTFRGASYDTIVNGIYDSSTAGISKIKMYIAGGHIVPSDTKIDIYAVRS